MAAKIYTLGQACAILGMPEPQLLELIDNRVLPAEFNQGLMSNMIRHEDLILFMKSRKMFAQMQKIIVSRVLLCDRDQQIVFILRTELERGGKITVQIATSSREVEMNMDDNAPDLLVMHIAATQRATDNLAGVLRRVRERHPTKLIIYHNEPEAVVEGREDIKRLKEYLKVDAMVSVAAGTRKLIASIEETLGIRRETKVNNPFATGGSRLGAPSATPPPNMLPTQSPPARKGNTAVRKPETRAGNTSRRTKPPTQLPPPP